MGAYISRRLIGFGINLILVSMFVFFLLRLVPGDVAGAVLGERASPEQVQQFKHQHGLDAPPEVQYLNWAGAVLKGDLGKSLRSNFAVTDEFVNRLPITLEVVAFSFSVTTVLGVACGIIAATRQNTVYDYGVRSFAIFGLSIPSFLLLTLLLIIPARAWNYAPPFGATNFFKAPWDNLQLFLPPTVLLAVGSSASLARLTRSTFLEVLRQDYMRTARAKGLAEKVVTFRHGFRNALPPVLTLAGLQLASLLGGSIIVEQVLGLPGLGTWALNAIQFKDYPVVMAVALYTASMLMVISLLLDLAYAALDRRISYN